METWIKHLNSPLVLIGFAIFIFAEFIKFLLKNNIIKFNQVNSAKLINNGLNYLFILALVSMAFGFFSQFLQATIENNKQPLKENIKKESSGNTIENSTITGSVVQIGGNLNNNKSTEK